jgi:hypothetical protein
MDGKFMKRIRIEVIALLFFLMVIRSVKSYPQELMEDQAPDFELLNFEFTIVQNGVAKLETTIRNNGSATTTNGAVPSIWEKVYFPISLSNGEGLLNESEIEYDLDGNGDLTNVFEVRWAPNATRPMDAIVGGVHVYSLYEADGSFNFSINGLSKIFQLGEKMHAMYSADNDKAEFLFDVILKSLPNPTIYWHLSTWDLDTIQHVNVSDFRINDELVELNHTVNTRQYNYESGVESWAHERWYIIPNQSMKIKSGEEVNFSCILTADQTVKIDLGLILAWSPDGLNRFFWDFRWEALVGYIFEVSTPLTTPPTSVSIGFSLLPPIIILMAGTLQRRKNRSKL